MHRAESSDKIKSKLFNIFNEFNDNPKWKLRLNVFKYDYISYIYKFSDFFKYNKFFKYINL
jgi:hypothetical protein